jgi:hypothetical protein
MNPIAISDAALKRFRDAAANFSHDAKSRASRLLAVKDDIAALRKKGASYRTIAELLTHNGIAASDTCVMRFCHRELAEKPSRNAKRKPDATPKAARASKHRAASPAPLSEAAQAVLLDDLLSVAPGNSASKPPNDDGPRIAKIEYAKPGEL